MAAQDADMATDYRGLSVFQIDNLEAAFAISGVIEVDQPSELKEAYMIELGGLGGPSVTYVMRGYDTTLTAIVYWESSTVDPTGANYAGPGPVTDVVISTVK